MHTKNGVKDLIIMGAWPELDTDIEADLDLTELDELISNDDPVFEPLKTIAGDIKKAIENGTKRGVLELAKRNVSWQEEFINTNCDNPSGMLASSITYTGSEYSYTTGTRINDIYPMSIEYGHKEIVPVRAKALAFYYEGELIFRKRVRKTDPRPFVAPAYERTDKVADELIVREIGHAGINWD